MTDVNIAEAAVVLWIGTTATVATAIIGWEKHKAAWLLTPICLVVTYLLIGVITR